MYVSHYLFLMIYGDCRILFVLLPAKKIPENFYINICLTACINSYICTLL